MQGAVQSPEAQGARAQRRHCSAMALVPVSQPVPAGTSDSLVPYGTSGDVGEPLESRLATLRANREAHSRKQIWTKDAHGGPYRKVDTSRPERPEHSC